MALKNSTSDSKTTFDRIQKILRSHGVTRMTFEYGTDGLITGLVFSMSIEGSELSFRMPAMVESVRNILYRNVKAYASWDKRYRGQQKAWSEQAYRTAWANIRDWIDAQMALIDTQQAKIDQVFLPYLLMDDDRTLYDRISQDQFKMLNSPR